MSDAVFEQYVDEYGNLSVRVSNDVVVLTKEDAARVVAEYNQLKAENAKLREELESVGMAAYIYGRDQLKAENAKLRELVDAWMGCGTRYHTMQGACPMFDSEAKDFCKAASLARELGIEVD